MIPSPSARRRARRLARALGLPCSPAAVDRLISWALERADMASAAPARFPSLAVERERAFDIHGVPDRWHRDAIHRDERRALGIGGAR